MAGRAQSLKNGAAGATATLGMSDRAVRLHGRWVVRCLYRSVDPCWAAASLLGPRMLASPTSPPLEPRPGLSLKPHSRKKDLSCMNIGIIIGRIGDVDGVGLEREVGLNL